MSSTCMPNSLISQARLPTREDIANASALAEQQRRSDSQAGTSSLLPGKDSHPLHMYPRSQLQINYEGRVSVVAHATATPIYSDVSTTLDDSGDDLVKINDFTIKQILTRPITNRFHKDCSRIHR